MQYEGFSTESARSYSKITLSQPSLSPTIESKSQVSLQQDTSINEQIIFEVDAEDHPTERSQISREHLSTVCVTSVEREII